LPEGRFSSGPRLTIPLRTEPAMLYAVLFRPAWLFPEDELQFHPASRLPPVAGQDETRSLTLDARAKGSQYCHQVQRSTFRLEHPTHSDHARPGTLGGSRHLKTQEIGRASCREREK